MNIALSLDSLTAVDQNERSPDEPYLWPVFFKIDAGTIDLSNLDQATFQVYAPAGSHGDLGGGSDDVTTGQTIAIPLSLGRWDTTLVTGDDLLPELWEKLSSVGVLVVAMEEDGTHDSAAEDGRKALVSALQDEATKQLRSAIRTALGTGTLPDFTKLASQIQDKVADAAKAAMKHATVSVFSFLPITSLFDIAGIVDPDDYIGSGTLGPFSFGEVATAGNAGKAFVLDLTGQGEGRYRVSGRIVRTSPDVEIVAAFGSSKASGDQVVHGTWSKFNSQWSTLSKAGKRLLSVATYVDGTDRIYVGVFRTGNENGYYLVDTDLSSFSTLRKQLNVDGLHVAGLQSYLANGTPRVVATFLPGPGREEMVIAPWDKFNSAGDKLKKEGMRLDRITVHGHGNNWDWVGIYHEAQDAQAFWVGDWSSFISQSNAQHKAGLRLRSVASYATPTGVLYAGVFRTGGEAEHIVRVSGWTAFDTLSQKQAAVHCLPLCVAVC